jgi:hypothetical protein
MNTEFKKGDIATAPNGNRWVYDPDLTLQKNWIYPGLPWLSTEEVKAIGLTVTSPPQVPRIVEGTATLMGVKSIVGDLPREWAGKQTKTVLSEDVLATIKCHRGKHPERDRVFTDDLGLNVSETIARLPGDNFTVLVLKGDS